MNKRSGFNHSKLCIEYNVKKHLASSFGTLIQTHFQESCGLCLKEKIKKWSTIIFRFIGKSGRDKETKNDETKRDIPSSRSLSKTCHCQGWVRLKLEARNLIQIFHTDGRLSCGPLSAASQGMHYQKIRIGSRESKPVTLTLLFQCPTPA